MFPGSQKGCDLLLVERIGGGGRMLREAVRPGSRTAEIGDGPAAMSGPVTRPAAMV